jgi:hypothetical protein
VNFKNLAMQILGIAHEAFFKFQLSFTQTDLDKVLTFFKEIFQIFLEKALPKLG